MLKRILLTLTCAAAFSAAGLALTDKAEGYRWRSGYFYDDRPRVAYYGPNYGYGYGSYYRGGYTGARYYYQPRYFYGSPYYYGRPYYGRPGPYVTIGW